MAIVAAANGGDILNLQFKPSVHAEDDAFSIRIAADYQPFYRFSILPECRYERRGLNLANNSNDGSIFGIDLSDAYGLRSR